MGRHGVVVNGVQAACFRLTTPLTNYGTLIDHLEGVSHG